MATNRADTLDPALLRPGRLDRKIEFPLPDRRQKRLILQVLTSKMNLSDEVDLEDCKYKYNNGLLQQLGIIDILTCPFSPTTDVSRPDKVSGAELQAIVQEAGMQAVRKNRYVILPKDFEKAYKIHVKSSQNEFQFYQ